MDPGSNHDIKATLLEIMASRGQCAADRLKAAELLLTHFPEFRPGPEIQGQSVRLPQ
jgi:hypothetical protein